MIKKLISCVVIAAALTSCKNGGNTSTDNSDTLVAEAKTAQTIPADTTFNLNAIPLSTKNLGEFPYLSYPEGYNFNYEKTINPLNIKDLDKEYFAVNGKLIPVEGKSYKVRIEKGQENEKKFSNLLVSRYYEEKILALGGVNINNVAVNQQEIKKVGDKELIEKNYGFSIDYNLLDNLKTYIIRTETKQIWIQMTLMDNEVGKLTVLEKKL